MGENQKPQDSTLETVKETTEQKIRRLMALAGKKLGNIQSYNLMMPFAEKIKINHPDYIKYRCYHILIGSTPSEKEIIEEDFDGEDSIIAFFEGLI